MNREEFRHAFRVALEVAAQHAEGILQREVPRRFRITLHGAGHEGDEYASETAEEVLELIGELFNHRIHIGVIEVSPHTTRIGAWIGYTPNGGFTVANYPPIGSFVQVHAEAIRIVG
jgi:hypothetical protein